MRGITPLLERWLGNLLARQFEGRHSKVSKVSLRLSWWFKDIALGTEGLGFDSRVGQIEHLVANGWPPLRCFFGAVLRRR